MDSLCVWGVHIGSQRVWLVGVLLVDFGWLDYLCNVHIFFLASKSKKLNRGAHEGGRLFRRNLSEHNLKERNKKKEE
jgi:hypothetical protein